MKASVEALYDAAVKQQDIEADTSQLAVVRALDSVLEKIVEHNDSWWPWQRKQPIKGVYIHGPVGVGKTYLMDLFYETLPAGVGKRFHFHQFMQQVDQQLRLHQGDRDPLKKIAQELRAHCQVLCFDEMMVHDVAYAMILAELFSALFAQGLIFITTSNTLPDQLYASGIQRPRFLPAIHLIKEHCQVMTLVARRDYRLNRQPLPTAWFSPASQASEQKMAVLFQQLEGVQDGAPIMVQNRPLPCYKLAQSGVWFDFDQICNMPRSQLDYIELANRFYDIFVSNIPKFTDKHTAQAVLFIYFIDIMYDNGVRLVLSCQVSLQDLCDNQELQSEFKRTISRLSEMQSEDYARRHQHRQPNAF